MFSEFLDGLDFVASVEALISNRGFRVYPADSKQITVELSQAIRGNGWEIDSLYAEHGRLDEVFRTITTSSTGNLRSSI